MTLALALVLLGGTLAHAQPTPTRAPRRRSVTLIGTALEARIAKGFRTVLVFSVPIRGKAVEVDSTRIQVVDTGEKSLILEPLSEPRPDERWTLRVPLADDRAPEVAEFTLVAHPAEVDAEIDVARAEKVASACQAACAPCPALRAIDVVALGLIDPRGVQTSTVQLGKDAESGFEWHEGVSYRAASWVLVDIQITLPPQYLEWRPTGATLTSRTGEARIRWVKVEPDGQIRQQVRVLAEADVPSSGTGHEFTLHLRGAEGTPSLSIPKVTLPPAKEQKP